MTRNHISLVLILFGFLCSPWPAGAQQSPTSIPGLVSQKPDSGHYVKVANGYMVPYEATIPGTDITFEMVPVPGGTFLMGSPESEVNRNTDEGPQRRIHVEPFWMGKYEVTWAEYKQFMDLHDIFNEFQLNRIREITDEVAVDVITAPSNLYEPTFTFEAGDGPRQPAVTMTQYAAKLYTKWLSRISEQFYRLPTEAEWEYACRAGSTTAFHFGDDIEQLGQYAWYADNSEEMRHDVGQKKPNAWGLYDMHGNAAEWVLDQYRDGGYAATGDNPLTVMQAFHRPTVAYPRVVRGGSWELEATACRSAARLGSEDEEWKSEDPNFPLSPWWYTSFPATGVGMRIIRPLTPPATRQEMEKFWMPQLDEIQEVADSRIDNEGRGARGRVDPQLPAAIKKLNSSGGR